MWSISFSPTTHNEFVLNEKSLNQCIFDIDEHEFACFTLLVHIPAVPDPDAGSMSPMRGHFPAVPDPAAGTSHDSSKPAFRGHTKLLYEQVLYCRGEDFEYVG